MPKRSYRTKKARVDPVVKLAATILPPEQCRNLAIRDVANHSEADQRASIRSGETRTVRKLTRVELLHKAGVITAEQVAACEWFVSCYEQGFHTVGCTANYNGAGGGSFGSSDLLARYRDQAEARKNYYYAKQAIPNHLLGLFEAVLFGSLTILGKEEKLRFSLAAFRLCDQVGHVLEAA